MAALAAPWLDSIDSYAKPESSVASDLTVISDFFGIKTTGKTMADLVGSTSSSLWRGARAGLPPGSRVAARISILAAFVLETRGYYRDNDKAVPEASDAYRWLMSGRMDIGHGPERVFDVLKDEEKAQRALSDIRARRHG